MNVGTEDVVALSELVRQGARPGNEQFDGDAHLSDVIPKPWGYEYRAYADDFFDFWNLHIEPGRSTSMHVHPRKLTYLLCMSGQGVTIGLTQEILVRAGTMVRIAGGTFHATRNIGAEPLALIEVELPRNKFDLIRYRDDYARAGTPYETDSEPADGHPMRTVPYLPNAAMRDRSPDGRFGFALRTGMDIFYRRRPQDIFHVPLGLVGLAHGEVEILTGLDNRISPATDQYYLSISAAA
ncbi:cupin domain-containing protein [Solihabitans fulvus]|uniref:Cupin domain-containing protein n=1 Tax=Solihabitans fulvus TaxID=1892852 RepID=A0A5B2XC31_9PSEU|nr:cupin domain-containing protein [Solihabitans fulvus]KAA2260650.1 cupin domain-containing protein [Solihabitans fulvus]